VLECPVEQNRQTGPDRTRTPQPGIAGEVLPQGSPPLTLLAKLDCAEFVLGWKKLGLSKVSALLPRHLCGDLGILAEEGQSGECAGPPARDHGQLEADSERGDDQEISRSGRGES